MGGKTEQSKRGMQNKVKKKKSSIFFIGVPEEERENWVKEIVENHQEFSKTD